MLMLSRPILAAVAIFVGAWNNFLWPFIVTTDAGLMTLRVGLQTVKSAYGLQARQASGSTARSPICAEYGVRDPCRPAVGAGFRVLPAPDHQRHHHHRFRRAVVLGQRFRQAGFRCDPLKRRPSSARLRGSMLPGGRREGGKCVTDETTRRAVPWCEESRHDATRQVFGPTCGLYRHPRGRLGGSVRYSAARGDAEAE
ncbi:MAG TPA: hypothetical protein VGD71_07805 [Kribbella sp.]